MRLHETLKRRLCRETTYGGLEVMLRFVVFCAMLVVGGMPLHADVIHVDSAGLQRMRTEGVTVIDVRRAEEWSKTGVIEGSHLLTFFDAKGHYDLGRWLPALAAIAESGQPVALICHSGKRSGRVARLLDEQLGYRHVYTVQDGISGWIEEGRSTVDRR